MRRRTLPGLTLAVLLAGFLEAGPGASAGPNSPPTAIPVTTEPGVFVVPPGQEGMHRELIPKNINIVRCYYDQDIVAPGTTFGFDINGSGFDEAFYRVITVDPDALDISVKNLRLITANQIHGQIEVGTEATTQFIHPKIMIRALPVFRAPEPFGVVRHGEVLEMELTSIDEGGQWGRFRVITNLDDSLYSKFRLEPTDSRLEVSNLKAQLPFYVDGVVMIAPGLKRGQYGLVARLGSHELFRQDPLVDVVKPNVGKTGSIEKVQATEIAHRPGDSIELMIKGSAFLPNVVPDLSVVMEGLTLAPSPVAYLSPGQLQAIVPIPSDAAVGAYGVMVLQKGKVLHKQPNVFAIVPPNWISSVKLASPLSPGTSGRVLIFGRDISDDYLKTLQITTDSDGLQVSNLRRQDAATLVANISVSTAVVPGDYLIHVAAVDKDLKLPRGNVIKINP
jgi:hypothetical protein